MTAQSNPGLYTGQVPTAAQWNGYFSSKLDAGGDGSAVTALPTGFMTPLSLQARFGQWVTPFDFGAAGNCQNYLGTANITASQTTLNVLGATFSAGDVGKIIVIGFAGATATTGGAVTAVAVSASGSGYTSIPTIAFSSGSASGVVSLQVLSATIVSGGTGYTASTTFTVTLAGGYGASAASLNVTTNSLGVITSVNSVSAPGAYSSLPATISACPIVNAQGGSGATFALTMGLASVTVTAQGSYSATPTVSLSGGSPASAGSLGAVTMLYDTLPLITSIVGFTSATSVTLANAAQSTCNHFTSVTWGTDDTAAIRAAVATGKSVVFPPGRYGITGTIEVYESGPTGWFGAGTGASALDALAVISGPMVQKTVYNAYVWTVDGIDFDAHRLATNNLLGQVGRQCRWSNLTAENAATGGANIVFGGTGTQAEWLTYGITAQNLTGYTHWASYPAYGIWNQATDGQHVNTIVAYAQTAGVYNTGSDTKFISPHAFGVMTYNFWDAAGGCYVSPSADSCAPGGAGMRFDYASGTGAPAQVSCPYVFWQPTPPPEGTTGILITNLAAVQVSLMSITGIDPANMIVQTGTPSQQTAIIAASNSYAAFSLGLQATSGSTGPSFALNTHDGTAVGGNTLGPQAVDLQLSRNGAIYSATGQAAFTAGTNNQADGFAAIAIGGSSRAQGAHSQSTGYQAFDNGQQYSKCHGFGLLNVQGGCQTVERTHFVTTTSTAAQRVLLGGSTSVSFAASGSLVFSTSNLLMLITASGYQPSTGSRISWICTNQQIEIGSTYASVTLDTTPTWALVAASGALTGASAPTMSVDTTFGAPSFTITPPNATSTDWTVSYIIRVTG
jgi:hypothetical protein